MERRQAIRGITILAIGSSFLPSCKLSSDQKSSQNNSQELKFLASVCGAILPVTDQKFKTELSSDAFTMMCVEECFSPEEKEKYKLGLQTFMNSSSEDFTKQGKDKQLEILKHALSEDADENVRFFLSQTRRLVLRNFTTTKSFMEGQRAYSMIPKPYTACVKLS